MSNEEIIYAIRSEVERLNKSYREQAFVAKANEDSYQEVAYCAMQDACRDFLSSLSKLSEKIGQVEPGDVFEKEAKRLMVKMPFFIKGKDQIAFARHFYNLGQQNKVKEPVCEELEEELDKRKQIKDGEELEKEVKRYLREEYDRDTTVGNVARHFAQWGAEHAKK